MSIVEEIHCLIKEVTNDCVAVDTLAKSNNEEGCAVLNISKFTDIERQNLSLGLTFNLYIYNEYWKIVFDPVEYWTAEEVEQIKIDAKILYERFGKIFINGRT